MHNKIEDRKSSNGVSITVPDSAMDPIRQVMMDTALEAFKQVEVRTALPFWMKKEEAATYANVAPKTLSKFIRQGLKVSIIDGVQRVSKKSIDEFYEQSEI
ncbi:hypothetical protein [Lactiplantibacillus plantarum]|uniref:hypothetical protein n=1 Tax=Lactiplantibacillus plantarum TaxID=1590 RepID=UPI003C2E0467